MLSSILFVKEKVLEWNRQIIHCTLLKSLLYYKVRNTNITFSGYRKVSPYTMQKKIQVTKEHVKHHSLYKQINIYTGEISVSLDTKTLRVIILGLRKDGITLIKIYVLTYKKKTLSDSWQKVIFKVREWKKSVCERKCVQREAVSKPENMNQHNSLPTC